MSALPRAFSGIQPTGGLHIGNYAGALRNWVALQEEMECIFCIVDYHSITMPYDPAEMPRRVEEAVLDVLACGVDPEKADLFIQSHVPEHTELCWILNCVAPMGELNRMTQFKEKSAQLESVNVGLYDYPVLQAADILLYKADTVPVGEDQLQHLELTREIARRFNHAFGETFPEPRPRLTPTPRVMALNDPAVKMSKSTGTALMLSAPEEEIRRRVRRAVTDTGPAGGEMSPGVKNLFALLEVFAPAGTVEEFTREYRRGTLRYQLLKEALTEHMLAVLRPIRERRRELAANRGWLREVVGDSARKLRRVAAATLEEVRQRMGLTALR